MGCASSSGATAGGKASGHREFVEVANPNFGAPVEDEESPRHAQATEKGNKKAVLVGCNYPTSQFELQGPHTDVRLFQQMLQKKYGFEDFVVLTDDSTSAAPSAAAIKGAFAKLVQGGLPGDTLLLYFSGQGTSGANPLCGGDEALVAADFNLIFAEDLKALINVTLAKNVELVIIIDSCFTFSLMKHSPRLVRQFIGSREAEGRYVPPEAVMQELADRHQINPAPGSLDEHLVRIFKDAASNHCQRLWTNHDYGSPPPPIESIDENLHVILVSACTAGETSTEVPGPDGRPSGVFTSALLEIAATESSPLTYRDAIERIAEVMADRNIVQHPSLQASHPGDVNLPFLGLNCDRVGSDIKAYVATGVPPSGFSVQPKGYNYVSYGLQTHEAV